MPGRTTSKSDSGSDKIVDIGDAKVAIGDKAILWGDEKLRVETVAHIVVC
jgi:alanine racemase